MKKRGRLAELGLSLGEEKRKRKRKKGTTEGRKRLKIRSFRKRVDRRE